MAAKSRRRDDPLKSREVKELLNRILDAINDQNVCWLSGEITGRDMDRVNTAYNEGVSAAEEAVVEVLRSAGFDPQPVPDGEGEGIDA